MEESCKCVLGNSNVRVQSSVSLKPRKFNMADGERWIHRSIIYTSRIPKEIPWQRMLLKHPLGVS
uniref:Uncharacterized protein n=1 Tax=Anguilla anguilla TaxID=7936 RepID=A0A0E9X093_ANGAN